MQRNERCTQCSAQLGLIRNKDLFSNLFLQRPDNPLILRHAARHDEGRLSSDPMNQGYGLSCHGHVESVYDVR